MCLSGLACKASNLSVNLRILWSKSFLSAANPDTAKPNKRPARRGKVAKGRLEPIRACVFRCFCVFMCFYLFCFVLIREFAFLVVGLSSSPRMVTFLGGLIMPKETVE